MFKVYAIYDSKAEAHLQPFFCMTNGIALRSFQAAAQDSAHDFHRFSADYTLFQLGDWEPKSGHFNLLERPINLGNASEFLATQETR